MEKKAYIHGVHHEEQERLRLLNKLTNAAFLDFVRIENGDRVLEIGSGLGIVANAIAGANPSARVTGIEYASEQIAGCERDKENLDFVQGDAHNLPFDHEVFNVIYGRYILEHLQDPLRVLQEVFRVMKPGGRVYFQENTISLVKFYPECPNFDFVWRQFIELQARLGGDAEIGIKLYSLLKKAGFSGLRLSFAEEIHYPEKGTLIPWVDNIIGNVEGAGDKLATFGLAGKDQIEEAIQELNILKLREDASAYFCWNRIAGKKES